MLYLGNDAASSQLSAMIATGESMSADERTSMSRQYGNVCKLVVLLLIVLGTLIPIIVSIIST